MTDVRAYEPGDEQGWLDCRVLSFRRTAYFDDVMVTKPQHPPGAIELVAIAVDGIAVDGTVAGVIDVTVEDALATIDTIAVHPGHSRSGIATALLDAARRALPPTVTTLDAWTWDDPTANGWYQARGFVETFRYLHVYAGDHEPDDAGLTDALRKCRPELTLVKGFFHAPIEAEADLRATFSRVHVCRRYELALT